MLIYFPIGFDTSIGIEKENVYISQIRNFDAFSSVCMRKKLIYSRGNGELNL